MIKMRHLAGAAGLLLCATATYALPTLQLDIPGGTYNNGDETIYAGSNPFNVVALLNGTLDTSRTYYISAAIEPMLSSSSPPPDVGSFTLGGNTFTTANMNFGRPPAANVDGDLQTHGEFPTYYTEYAFNFTGSTVPAYNTADGTTSPGTLYDFSLAVDVSSLMSGYSVHFDLYDVTTDKNGNVVIDDFAPFSHDAQSGPNTSVPDGGSTVALLGLALAGAGALRRKMRK